MANNSSIIPNIQVGFTEQDGTLSREGYRILLEIIGLTGSVQGDNGSDVTQPAPASTSSGGGSSGPAIYAFAAANG